LSFKIYRSSAGSGKTFTLVKEYLRIALASDTEDAYRAILAITFTNKAAEEMKSRVLETLSQLSNNSADENPMTALLTKELGVSKEKLTLRAKRVFKHMLHHYSDISISTIDNFTHKVIRTFAQDLGLSMNFEVELDTTELSQQVVDELLNRVGTESILTDALIDVTQSQIDDEKSWSVDDKLKEFVSVLFSEESRFHLEKLKRISLKDFNELRKKLRINLYGTREELKKIGTDFIRSMTEKGLRPQSFAGGKNGIFNFFNKFSIQKFDAPTVTVIKNFEQDKWYGSSATAQEKEAIDEWQDEITWKYRTCLKRLEFTEQYKIIFDNIYAVALLEKMYGILNNLQLEKEILHIGEFNHVVSNVVMQESAPFIYERIGHRFRDFLIDEFQDTSVLQWFNLLPLIDESLAHNNMCLVVGDAKQSIYRWRGGDVQQFIELPSIHRTAYLQERTDDQPELKQLLNERENVLIDRAETESLDTNYRSPKTIVEFNNYLFSYLQNGMPEAFKNMYDNSAQKSFNNTEGLVEVKFFQQEDKGRTWPDYSPLTLEQIKHWVETSLEDGFAPADIAIICRNNAHSISVAQFLIEAKYKVVSNESLLINSSPKVRLLINLATFLLAPENSTNNAELIQHLGMVRSEISLTSARLMQANAGKKNSILALLTRLYPGMRWGILNRQPIYSLFESLIHGLFAKDTEPHLRFFLDEVLNFNQNNGNDLGGFIEHWSKKRESISIALTEDREAIRILTVHKSKGLEFPVVIHPFADYSNTSTRNSIWVYSTDSEINPLDRLYLRATSKLENTSFSESLERENALIEMDMYNILYVALTRPRQRLYVCGKLKKANAKDQSPATAIQFLHQHLLSKNSSVTEELTFVLGNRKKAKEREEMEKYLQLHPTGDPFWMQRIRISRPSARQWKASSEAVSRGNLMHEILALIKVKQDVKPAILQFVESGIISKNDISELEESIDQILRIPELTPFFSEKNNIRNEADIQLEGGKWVRPDRVVWKNEKAWVIDYKTGAATADHRKQVASYKDALLQLGFTDVKGMLVYIDAKNVVAV